MKQRWVSLVLLLGILCLDVFLIRMEYQNYKDKYYIVSYLLEEQQNGELVQKAASVLLKKYEKDTIEQGERWLEENSFPLHYPSYYFKRFQINILAIVIVSLLFYLLFLFALWYLKREESKRRNQLMDNLEQMFLNLKRGNTDFSEFEPKLSKESKNFYMELESFLSFYQVREEQIKIEKEGVKSLVSDISHQLKTPFAALKTSFEILQRENVEQKGGNEFYFRHQKQLDAIEVLLDALIQISRMEGGLIQIKREYTSIFDTLLAAFNRIYINAEEKKINLELEALEDLQMLEIPHDKKWMCEAVLNILENAVKYSTSGTTITIRMEKLPTFLRIEIQDQGIGIPKHEYNKVFQRFYRGGKEEVRQQTGSGIGLYLTREIITRHSGTISVASSTNGENTGSRFILQLPYRV